MKTPSLSEVKYFIDKARRSSGIQQFDDWFLRCSNALLAVANQQTKPTEGRDAVTDKVISDLTVRAVLGKKDYETYLMTFNDQDALVGAYQAALDLAVCLKQELLEREEAKQKSAQLWNDGEYVVEIINGVWHTKINKENTKNG